MPTLSKKNKCPYGPDDRVRAWQSFATATETVREGDVLPGDDPIVVGNWTWFQPVDTPTRERKSIWTEMPEPPEHRLEDATRVTIHTNSAAHVPPHRLVRATSDFWAHEGYARGSHGDKANLPPTGRGWGITRGQVVEVSHPLVAQHPEAFEFMQRPCTVADVERLAKEVE